MKSLENVYPPDGYSGTPMLRKMFQWEKVLFVAWGGESALGNVSSDILARIESHTSSHHQQSSSVG